MKFTLGWLKEHLDTTADAATVAETLTRIGLEVEAVHDPAAVLAPFRIARVLTAERHPAADKLQILSVDAGDGPVQVVCGAPNARAGMTGVFGAPGTHVPGSDLTLKVAAIRGVESRGMMCSARELGLGEEHDGILELPDDAPVGGGYARWAGLDDPVFDVAITPNRQDCMGVRGIARDLAAAGLGTLRPFAPPARPGDYDCPVTIRTDDPNGCPAFYGRVIRGVRNDASPPWLQQRLRAIGQRPISALVDITNYLMFDLGRPSHAYDLAKLTGAIVARRAALGEEVTALNGRRYALNPEMTVIADDVAVHDIAGIMGGEHSGVAPDTTDILLEVAYFTPERIAATGRALGLMSDARARFERGVDPGFLDAGLDALTAMIIGICGGTPSRVVRAGSPPCSERVVAFDPSLTERLGGLCVPEAGQRDVLNRLGFDAAADGVRVPPWRRDVDGPADLVEEIIRIVGVDSVRSQPLPRDAGVARPTATPLQKIEARARRTAAARGLAEAITWSFITTADAEAFGEPAWTLLNPISEDMRTMRPSMLPGLLSAARRNLDRGEPSVRLFEVGRRYLADAERPTVGVVLAGERTARDWRSGRATAFDGFDAKAEAMALLAATGAPVENLQVAGDAGDAYHPGQSGTLRLGPKTILAAFGRVHPRIERSFGLDGPVVACEVFLDAVPARRTQAARPAYAPSPLQPVRRDFAFLVPAEVSADAVARAIRSADKAAIVAVRLFDRFVDASLGGGVASLAFEVTLQPADRSFDEAQLLSLSDRIVAAAGKLGATLRR